MRDLTAKATELGKAEFETFRNKALPELRDRATNYKNQLEKDGRKDDAKQFWDRFVAWVAEVEKSAQ